MCLSKSGLSTLSILLKIIPEIYSQITLQLKYMLGFVKDKKPIMVIRIIIGLSSLFYVHSAIHLYCLQEKYLSFLSLLIAITCCLGDAQIIQMPIMSIIDRFVVCYGIIYFVMTIESTVHKFLFCIMMIICYQILVLSRNAKNELIWVIYHVIWHFATSQVLILCASRFKLSHSIS